MLLGRYGSATAVFAPRAALGLDPRAWEGVGSRSSVPNRRHQPRSVIMLTPCRARYRASHAAPPWRCPTVAAGHQRSVNVAISPPVRGHGCQTFLTETLTYHESTVHKRMRNLFAIVSAGP